MTSSPEVRGSERPAEGRADQLSRLVLDALAEPGATYVRLSSRSIDPQSGIRLSGSYLHGLGQNKVVRAPEISALRALAAGLNLPLSVVQQAAAAQYLRYEAEEFVGYGDDVRIIVARLAGMTEDEVRLVRRIVEVVEFPLSG